MRQQPFPIPYLVSHIPTKSVSPPAQRESYLKPPTLQPRPHNRADINNRWFLASHEDRRMETRSQDRLERINNSNIIQRRDPKPQQNQPPNDLVHQLQTQIKMLYEENNTLKAEYHKIEKQRSNLQQNYSQLLQMYDQSQREIFSLQQRLQQLAIDCQYNEQYKQKLHEFVEQQKQVIQKLQEEKSIPVVPNNNLIELELENETLKQELIELRASLQHLTQYVEVRNRANTRQSESSTFTEKENTQPYPDQQERLLALSRELLREASNFKGNEDYELLQKWRKYMMEKYSLESKTPSQPVSDTKQKYKRFNRLVQETAGLLSFRLKPRDN